MTQFWDSKNLDFDARFEYLAKHTIHTSTPITLFQSVADEWLLKQVAAT